MGQTTSTAEASNSPDGKQISLTSLTKEQVHDAFLKKCVSKLSPLQVKSILTKMNISSLRDPFIVSGSDLAFVLGLSQDKSQDNSAHGDKFKNALILLYGSFEVLGKFPFIQDYLFTANEGLSLNDLIIASFFHSGRYAKTLGFNYDYLKLVFISISYACKVNASAKVKDYQKSEKKSNSEKPNISEEYQADGHDTYVVEALTSQSSEPDQDQATLARRIKWSTFGPIKSFDEIDETELTINAYDLIQILTLFLIIESIPRKKHSLMQSQAVHTIANRWDEFETCVFVLIRYIDIDLSLQNLKTTEISYLDFKEGAGVIIEDLIQSGFKNLFNQGLFSSFQAEDSSQHCESQPQQDEEQKPQTAGQYNKNQHETKIYKSKGFPKFEESRLVNVASIALISNCLSCVGSSINVTPQNLIKLYKGSESGFSMRSLESKIFKWQAPTLFLVSGKRLKSKTTRTNRRYQKFTEEYPRYFRSDKESMKPWQGDNDRITYAVVVNQPWRASNKRNFGDEDTIIMCLSPRLDFYKSISKTSVHKGESIYFNNLGMGLGFGNDQPVNKNNVRKYLPGDISLTIEANLEFAVFRHISSTGTSASTHFAPSQQSQLIREDFEDRFMITDLEVWGVGSTAELEEQRKQWEWEEKQAEARQSVNIKNMGEDRAFMEMVGLVGNAGASGGSM